VKKNFFSINTHPTYLDGAHERPRARIAAEPTAIERRNNGGRVGTGIGGRRLVVKEYSLMNKFIIFFQ